MLLPGQAHSVFPGEGEVADLGIVRMRVLAAGEPTTNRSFSLLEFSGDRGPWTVPHIHQGMEESFYVLDGEFEFHVGPRTVHLRPGESVFVPRNVPHVWVCTNAGGGKVINVYQPAGNMEAFFREIGKYDGKPHVHEALGVDGLRQLFAAHGMDLLGPPLGWKD